ncbi:MAG: periplasmic heavy metal sensor [Proteobacteria bacterium]|nr:periplasmic heavy metal sensor [Pseudomonadota bacterium]
MKSKLRTSMMAVCVIGAGFLVTSCAPKTFSDKVDWGTSAASSYLDLTDEQEPALQQIADTIKIAYPDFKTIRGDLQSVLRQELEKEAFDTDAVDAQVNTIRNKVLSLTDELTNEFATFHQGLTAEQRESIAKHTHDEDDESGFSRHHGRDHWKSKRSHAHIMKDFDLQPEQALVLKKIFSGIAADSVDLMMAKSQLKKSLKEELASENFDVVKVRTQLRSAILIVFDSIDRQLPIYTELHSLFTSEQREILVQAVDHWIERSQDQD